MKKIFTNKSIVNKILIAIIIIMLFNFAMPKKVEAGLFASMGGTIATNLLEFIAFLGDCVIALVEYCFNGGEYSIPIKENVGEKVSGETQWADKDKIDLPYIELSPEEIFTNKIAALNINFIQDVDETIGNSTFKADNTETSLRTLRSIISKWYIALRTLAFVGLLSVLVYTGIRIMISSTAQDKAKYKEKLMDLVVALCLLLFLHYIMFGTIKITNSITSMLSNSTGEVRLRNNDVIRTGTNVIDPFLFSSDYLHPLGVHFAWDDAWIGSGSLRMEGWSYDNGVQPGTEIEQKSVYEGGDGAYAYEGGYGQIVSEDTQKHYETFSWKNGGHDYYLKITASGNGVFNTVNYDTIKIVEFNCDGNDIVGDSIQQDYDDAKNLMNFARLYSDVENMHERFGFVTIYIVLVVYTVMFVFRYMKRLIYVAFLTLMAPLVALTYPIDKMRDGNAQAFNMWLKEYVFNVLIQPFHLLIYIILVGSAIELASTNLVYALVAIGFILPAENLLRKFFGFENASTLSAAGSFMGGAALASMFNMMKKPFKGKGNGKGGDKGKEIGGAEGNDDKINYYNSNADSALDGLESNQLEAGNDNNDDNGVDRTEINNNDNIENGPEENTNDRIAQEFGINYNDNAEELTNNQNQLDNPNDGQEVAEQNSQAVNESQQTRDSNVHTQQLNNTSQAQSGLPIRRYRAPKGTKKKGRIGRRLKRMSAGIATGASMTFGKGRIGRRLIKGVAKGTLGVMGAGTAATIGLAAGIASGDPSKAFQYASLGAGAGAVAGTSAFNAAGSIANKGVQTVKSIPNKYKDVRDEYHKRADTKEEYKEYQERIHMAKKERAMEEFRKNDTVLSSEFSRAEAERIMDDALPEYFDKNITSGKEIAAIEKYKEQMMEQNKNMSEQEARMQAMQEYRVNKELKTRGITKHKDKVEEIRSRLEKSGMDKEGATEEAERIIRSGNMMNDDIANM